MSQNLLENTLYHLLQDEPFFANFLLASKVVYDHKEVERAAVSFKGGRITFYFNTSWYSTLSLSERIGVLKHEVFHLLLDHVGNRQYGNQNHKAKNVAMDCAINQYIHGLPENCVTLKSLSEMCGKQLLPFETWEYYYHQMKDVAENNINDSSDHDAMFEGEGEMTEAEASMRQAAIRDQADKAIKASKGKIPDGVGKILAQLNQGAKVNWKQQLRNIISSSRVVQTKPSRQKVHRRFELDQPGRKKDKRLVLGVCVDSSGSVSDEAFAMFMNEVYHIAKMTSVTYLIHADSEVQKVEVIKGGKAKKEKLAERHGNGGTCYQPAIKECVKRQCDVIIYQGDMDAADTPENPGVPFVWVRVGKQDPPGNFGKVIDLD